MRPYPWKCGECKAKAVVPTTIPHTAEIRHDGSLHTVAVPDLPVHRCDNCGAVAMGTDADFKIRAKLRDDLGLLQPEVIRAKRLELELTQEQLADLLNFAPESVCRWERGVIQSRAYNTILEAFFDVPELREYLIAEAALAKAATTEDDQSSTRVQVEFELTCGYANGDLWAAPPAQAANHGYRTAA